MNGVRLFFDVSGPLVVPDGDVTRERRSIILLHGGPGMDHTVFKPAFDALARHAQVIYVDHRGCGRSDVGSASTWRIEQWAEDVAALVAHLGIHRPIVLGTSFGGFVAQRTVAKHPTTFGGLVLMSTTAREAVDSLCEAMGHLGGSAARDTARAFFSDAAAPGVIERYFEACLRYYTCGRLDTSAITRVRMNRDVIMHFFARGSEFYGLDLRADLAGISVPTLIVHGRNDPVFPPGCAEEMFAQLRCREKRLVYLENCSHLSEQDAPDEILDAIIDFFDLR
ncbi:MAG: alpha/beta fold hydrolase [Gammaproteobacteria bacterium]